MITGSPVLWEVADLAGVVPCPPDAVVARLLSEWWSRPRSFGCVSAKWSTPWLVIAPSPDIWCASCAEEQLARERRCIYCGRDVRPRRANLLVHEMHESVRVVARAHLHCTERNQ
jgi:hypothetical protein